jgi:hypothetical protein
MLMAEGEGRVSFPGIDTRTKGIVEDTGRVSGWVEGHIGDQFAISIAETEAGEVTDGKERGFNTRCGSASFKRSSVSAAWNVVVRGNRFGGAVNRSIFQQGIGEVIKAAGFHVGRSSNRRCSWKQESLG